MVLPAGPPAPTMRDVADLAGVGLGTVSRVVNGGASVRPATAERVRHEIDELGFRRNEIARALRPGNHSALVALLAGDLTNPFYATMAKTVVECARSADLGVVVSMVDEDPQAERRVVQDLLSRRVAGLLVVPDRGDHTYLQAANDSGTPVVLLDRPAVGVEADSVVADNERGGWLAGRHLLEHGHRRMAVLVAPSHYTTGRRVRGFRRALRAADVDLADELTVTLPVGSAAAAAEATDHLLGLAEPPTAIFATTGVTCEGALRALTGRSRPAAVVGFDDFRLADLLPVPATVVTSDVGAMSRTAFDLLSRRIAGDRGAVRRVVVPVELIVRGSGELSPPNRSS